MKKILILLFVVFSFVGCSTGTSVEDDYTENEVVEPTKEPAKPVEEPTVEPPVVIENPTLEDFSKVKDLSYLEEFYGVADKGDYDASSFLSFETDTYIKGYGCKWVYGKGTNGFSDNGRKVLDDFVDFIKSNFSEDFYKNKVYELTYKDQVTYKSKDTGETEIKNGKIFLLIIFEEDIEKNGEIQLGRSTYIKAEDNEQK